MWSYTVSKCCCSKHNGTITKKVRHLVPAVSDRFCCCSDANSRSYYRSRVYCFTSIYDWMILWFLIFCLIISLSKPYPSHSLFPAATTPFLWPTMQCCRRPQSLRHMMWEDTTQPEKQPSMCLPCTPPYYNHYTLKHSLPAPMSVSSAK